MCWGERTPGVSGEGGSTGHHGAQVWRKKLNLKADKWHQTQGHGVKTLQCPVTQRPGTFGPQLHEGREGAGHALHSRPKDTTLSSDDGLTAFLKREEPESLVLFGLSYGFCYRKCEQRAPV